MTDILLIMILIVLIRIHSTLSINKSHAATGFRAIIENTKELFIWLWASIFFVVILFLSLSLIAFMLGLVTKEMLGISSYWFYNSTWQ
jgi:hypothetical protein